MIYLICTPIGNLNDISLRSIEILNSSDLIYAEDTRKAQKIFDRYKIDKNSFSFNDHNERSKTKSIIKEARVGKTISLISMKFLIEQGFFKTQNLIILKIFLKKRRMKLQ